MRAPAPGGWRSSRTPSGQPPQRRLHAGRSRPRFGHAPPLRSHRRPHHAGRNSRLFKCRDRSREGRKRFLSPEIAAKAPKDAQQFFQSAQAIAAPYIKSGEWHTFSGSEPIVDGMQIVPLPGHTPGHTGYEFTSQGKSILFWGDIIHAQRVQFEHPELTVIYDFDPRAAAATRNQLLPKLAHENIVIAGPHLLFPGLGRLHKAASGYSWAPVAYTDQWVEK